MKTKKILLFIGGLLLMLGLSACSFFRGTRNGIEKRISVLEEIYPTQNINDLKAKFPEGLRLVNIKSIGDISYSVILENDKPSATLKGTFSVEERHPSDSPEPLFETEVEVNESGSLISAGDVPEEYKEVLEQYHFLFQHLDLSDEARAKFNYYTHSSNANDDYFISYNMDNLELANYMGIQNSQIKLSIDGHFAYERNNQFYKGLTVRTESGYVSETIESEGQLYGKK